MAMALSSFSTARFPARFPARALFAKNWPWGCNSRCYLAFLGSSAPPSFPANRLDLANPTSSRPPPPRTQDRLRDTSAMADAVVDDSGPDERSCRTLSTTIRSNMSHVWLPRRWRQVDGEGGFWEQPLHPLSLAKNPSKPPNLPVTRMCSHRHTVPWCLGVDCSH